MSQAFMRETDGKWLSDVSPTLQALIMYLTRENNGIRVYEKSVAEDSAGRQLHAMSNGLAYAKDAGGKWEVVL